MPYNYGSFQVDIVRDFDESLDIENPHCQTRIIKFENGNYIGLNNCDTDFFARLGYLMWVLRGSNMLKPLEYYTKKYSDCVDKDNMLRGAYGPRIKMWIGPDALQEAINVNKDIDSDEDMVKPKGVNQLLGVFKELNSGMSQSQMMIFDPSIDFDETNYVPDLNSVLFNISGNLLNKTMIYPACSPNHVLFNDLWLINTISSILASFMDGVADGYTNVVIANYTTNRKSKSYYDAPYTVTDLTLDNNYFNIAKNNPNDFWSDFEKACNYEMHMRMQFNTDTFFLSSEINICNLLSIMNEHINANIKNVFIKDLLKCMLCCVIIRHSINDSLNEILKLITYEINDGVLVCELCAYARYFNYSTISVEYCEELVEILKNKGTIRS